MRTKTYIENLRHGSLGMGITNKETKFELCIWHAY